MTALIVTVLAFVFAFVSFGVGSGSSGLSTDCVARSTATTQLAPSVRVTPAGRYGQTGVTRGRISPPSSLPDRSSCR